MADYPFQNIISNKFNNVNINYITEANQDDNLEINEEYFNKNEIINNPIWQSLVEDKNINNGIIPLHHPSFPANLVVRPSSDWLPHTRILNCYNLLKI